MAPLAGHHWQAMQYVSTRPHHVCWHLLTSPHARFNNMSKPVRDFAFSEGCTLRTMTLAPIQVQYPAQGVLIHIHAWPYCAHGTPTVLDAKRSAHKI